MGSSNGLDETKNAKTLSGQEGESVIFQPQDVGLTCYGKSCMLPEDNSQLLGAPQSNLSLEDQGVSVADSC